MEYGRIEVKAMFNISGEFSRSEVDTMADAMAISRRQLFRRVKKLTGLTPNAYIQEARYRRARLLLENQSFPSVKAIAYEVGMKDVRYFSQQFRSRFGKLPSAYF